MSDDVRPGDGMLVGRAFGVPIVLSWTWFVGALIIAWVFVPVVEVRLPSLEGWAFAVALCFAVLLGLSVLIHELAHAVMALRLGQSVRRITLHLLGGVSEIEGAQSKPWADFVIAAVGPIASLLVAAIAYGALQFATAATVLELVLWQLAVANLIVGVFNLIPGLPLDGGRMLKDAVWAASGREYVGTVTAAWVGRGLAALLVVSALLPLAYGRNDILWLVWGLLLAGFIWIEAGRALRNGRLRQVFPMLHVRMLTRRAVPVFEELSVGEGLRRLAASQAGAIVTTDRSDRPLGVVNEAAVSALPEIRRPWVSLSAVARALPESGGMPIDLGGEDLVQWLTQHPAPEYLVTHSDGTIYGVLARADVETAISRELTRR